MAYSDELLAHNERKLYETHQHWFVLIRHGFQWVFLSLLLIAAMTAVALKTTSGVEDGKLTLKIGDTPLQGWLLLFFLVLLIVCIARFVWEYLTWMSHEFIVTNQHVISVKGVLNKIHDDARLDHVNDTDIAQSFFGRLLGYGDLRIMTGNDEDMDNPYHMIENPAAFKRAVNDAITNYDQSKRGINAQEMQEMLRQQQQQYAAQQAAQQQPYPVQPRPQPQAQAYYVQADPQAPINSPFATSGAGSAFSNQQPYATGETRAPYIAGPDEQTSVGGYAPPRRASQPRSVNNPGDIPTLLKKLAELRDAGVITEQDFQQKKAELMSRM